MGSYAYFWFFCPVQKNKFSAPAGAKERLLVIELLHLVAGFAGDVDAEAVIDLDILFRDDHGEVRAAAAKAVELLLRHGGDGIRECGDAKGNEHLIGVESRVAMAEVTDLELGNRLHDGKYAGCA